MVQYVKIVAIFRRREKTNVTIKSNIECVTWWPFKSKERVSGRGRNYRPTSVISSVKCGNFIVKYVRAIVVYVCMFKRKLVFIFCCCCYLRCPNSVCHKIVRLFTVDSHQKKVQKRANYGERENTELYIHIALHSAHAKLSFEVFNLFGGACKWHGSYQAHISLFHILFSISGRWVKLHSSSSSSSTITTTTTISLRLPIHTHIRPIRAYAHCACICVT